MATSLRRFSPFLNEHALFTKAATFGDTNDLYYHSPCHRIACNYTVPPSLLTLPPSSVFPSPPVPVPPPSPHACDADPPLLLAQPSSSEAAARLFEKEVQVEDRQAALRRSLPPSPARHPLTAASHRPLTPKQVLGSSYGVPMILGQPTPQPPNPTGASTLRRSRAGRPASTTNGSLHGTLNGNGTMTNGTNGVHGSANRHSPDSPLLQEQMDAQAAAEDAELSEALLLGLPLREDQKKAFGDAVLR